MFLTFARNGDFWDDDRITQKMCGGGGMVVVAIYNGR